MKKLKSASMVSFSTTLSKETKNLLERYCEKKGVRMNHLVESAILEWIEDDMDTELIQARLQEDTVAWKKHA